MIYVLVPHENVDAIRVFGTFGIVEQTLLRQGNMRLQWHLDPDWCTVYGYESGTDEFTPVWVWHVSQNGTLVRQHFIQ